MLNHNNRPTILFTHYGDHWIRGSERCLLDLISNINRERYNVVLWCNSNLLIEQTKDLNIPTILTNFSALFNHKTGLFGSVESLVSYLKIIRTGIELVTKYDINLIHSNSAAPNLWLNLISRMKNIPLISHLHSYYLLRERISFGLHHVPITVGVSPSVIATLRKDGVACNQLKVIENGLDIEKLAQQNLIPLRKQLNIRGDAFVVAATGSLIHRKGFDIAIATIVAVRKEGIPIHLVIVGDGPQREALESQITLLHASHYIHLYGDSANVVGLLKSGIDLFISTTREEAFGLSLAEASLAGLPVIAPKIGEFPNIVLEGVSGRLFDPLLDFPIHYIREFYFDSSLGQRMGRNGSIHIQRNYGIHRYVSQFDRLYSSVISDSNMKMSWRSHWKISIVVRTITKKCLSKFCATFRRGWIA